MADGPTRPGRVLRDRARSWLVGSTGSREEDEHLRRALRRFRLFASIFLVYLGYAFDGLDHPSTARLVLAVVLLVLFVALYLGPLPVGVFLERPAQRVPVLLAMSAVMAAYLLLVGPGGLIFGTYLSISLVTALRPPVSAPLVLVMTVAIAVLPQQVRGWDVQGVQWATAGPCLLTAIAMYAVRIGNRNNRELLLARQEVARLAAEQERLRIARDLHDLLGHALTTVTLKAELAARLVAVDPDRAAREMGEVAQLARNGLTDVRATVAGYREVSLVTELAAAREVLTAAGMVPELPATTEQVPADLRELFGWVVREAVTNAVRHSRAQHVRVQLTGRGICVADDGVGPAADAVRGSGLAGLAERVAAAGGRLSAGPGRPGWRVEVEVPAQGGPHAPAATAAVPAAVPAARHPVS